MVESPRRGSGISRTALFLAILLFFPLLSGPAGGALFESKVKRVIDGDTIVLKNGEHVRYLGIDSPEKNEPFYKEAKTRNVSLVSGRRVLVSVCEKEPRDKYGRLLAWVYTGGVFVNREMLTAGLAKKLMIGPCALEKEAEFAKAEDDARAAKKGIWGDSSEAAPVVFKDITPEQARANVWESVRVTGKVTAVIRNKASIFIDVGGDNVLRLIVNRRFFKEFRDSGVDLMGLKGRTVEATGVVKIKRGIPEIYVNSASQIRPK